MAALLEARRRDLTRQTTEISPHSRPPAITELRGATVVADGRELIFSSSNDRLGLAADPRVREAAADAATRFGVGLGSPYLGGRLSIHDELEMRLAEFVGKEAAVLFNSGYLANVGCIPALVQESDVIVADIYAHACIQDGMRLSKGTKRKFRHNDMQSLREQLVLADAAQKQMIVVDGIYSMHGDFCHLPEIIKIAREFNADVFVDDAHGFCTAGVCGRGTGSHFGSDPAAYVTMGTFNKGLGSLGGFVAADRDTIEYIRTNARTIFFTASMPPPAAAAALMSLSLMQSETYRLDLLWENARRLWEGLQDAGYRLQPFASPIIPVSVRPEIAGRLCSLLIERGVFAQFVGYPAIPRGKTIFRVAAMSSHSTLQIDQIVGAFRQAIRIIGEVLPAEGAAM